MSDTAITFWSWLFPITYLIHIAEEYYAAEGYSAYLLKLRGVELSNFRFLTAHTIGLLLIIVGIFLAQRLNFRHTLLVILGATVLVNGITHTITSFTTRSYGPGLISSLVLWIPLGLATLFQFYGRMSNQRFWFCGAIGLGINAAIVVFTMRGGRFS
jgi:uncharacterized membrane protein HdeD (DUF308 family)